VGSVVMAVPVAKVVGWAADKGWAADLEEEGCA
jgi:hypothetical protein